MFQPIFEYPKPTHGIHLFEDPPAMPQVAKTAKSNHVLLRAEISVVRINGFLFFKDDAYWGKNGEAKNTTVMFSYFCLYILDPFNFQWFVVIIHSWTRKQNHKNATRLKRFDTMTLVHCHVVFFSAHGFQFSGIWSHIVPISGLSINPDSS